MVGGNGGSGDDERWWGRGDQLAKWNTGDERVPREVATW